MNELTITINFEPSQLAHGDTPRLDQLMDSLGFKRNIHNSPKFSPKNLIAHPNNRAHYTYTGFSEKNASEMTALLSVLIEDLKLPFDLSACNTQLESFGSSQ